MKSSSGLHQELRERILNLSGVTEQQNAGIHDDAFFHRATNPDFSRAAKPRVDWAVARHFRTPKCDDTISLPSAGDFADFAQRAGENFRIDELLGVHCCL